MLEMLLDKKLLFVLMGILTGLGVADKCIVSMTMKRMVEAAGSMSKSNHPLMRLVRAKFEHACMISDTVENVGVFVDKYLYEYKVCGLRLHTLRRLEKICAGLLIVAGLAGAGLTYQVYGMGDAVLRTGAVGVGLGILVWLFHLTTDENYCMQMAKNYMVDYLENVCLHKYEKMNQKERSGRADLVNEMKNDEIHESEAYESGGYGTEAQQEIIQEKGMAEVQKAENQKTEKKETDMKEEGAFAVSSEPDHSVVQIQRENRRKERTKGTARNLARASARLAATEENEDKSTANTARKNLAAAEMQNQEAEKSAEQNVTEELPKDEMIRQILKEFMA